MTRNTYQIWEELYDQWPETERQLSKMTRQMAWDGIPVDYDKLAEGIDSLEQQLFEVKQNLPWYDQIDPDTKKKYVVYSKKAMALECRKAGVEPPKSMAQDSPELNEWIKEHGDKLKFVSAMQNYNRLNMHLTRMKNIKARLTDDSRMSYNLKYFGADATGRWSGDAGFNVQNLPRETRYGVNIRNMFSAPEGKTFVVADLSQIEPRLTAFIAGDTEFLDLIKKGMSPYEAHARQTMGWTGGKLKDEDPELYLLAKVRGWWATDQVGTGLPTLAQYGQQQILDMGFSRKDEIVFKISLHTRGKGNLYPTLRAGRQWWQHSGFWLPCEEPKDYRYVEEV